MKKKKEDLNIKPVRMGKDKLLKAVNGMLMSFKNSDGKFVEAPVELSNFGKYLRRWTGNNSTCSPFLEKHKAVKIKKKSVGKKARKSAGNTATLYKDKIIKLKKYLDRYSGECVPIGERRVYGNNKNKRSFTVGH